MSVNLKQHWRLTAIIVILLVFAGWQGLGQFTNNGYSPAQPIPFSHRLHAGVNHIPCMYCHAGVEYSAQSPIPPLNVCMGCHSVVDANRPVIQRIAKAYASGTPYRFVRMYKLPEFVKFRHAPHIDAGIACQTCHGQVEEMTQVTQVHQFAMGECINCHRNTNYLPSAADRTHRDYMLAYLPSLDRHINAPVDCNTCHN